MKKLSTVVLVGILSASFGLGAFAAETAAPKDKLVAQANVGKHMDKHKSHRSAKTNKLEKSTSTSEHAK